MRGLLIAVALLGCRSVPAVALSAAPKILPAKGPAPELRDRLLETSDGCFPQLAETVWKNKKAELATLAADTVTNIGANLYTVQARTATFLMGLERCHRFDLLDEYAAVMLEAFRNLRPHAYIGVDAQERFITTWRQPGEGELAHPLNAAQFMYPIAVLLRIYAESNSMPARLTEIAPLVRDHYRAWILYHRRFAAPDGMLLTHYELVRLKRRFPQLHLTDLDLWVLAGAVELLAANEHSPDRIGLDPKELDRLREYVLHGVGLFESHLERTQLTSPDGRRVEGALLDPGAYADHEEHQYAGYQGERFPGPSDRAIVPRDGWDISHHVRVVSFLESVSRHRASIGTRFPDRDDLMRFANQYAYRVFNGDTRRPLFANYWDGSNGWYRVGFDGRGGFAYGPSDLSSVALSSGYGFWAEINPDVDRINCALLRMIAATEATDPELAHHRDAHYGRYWMSNERRTLLDLDLDRSWELLSFPSVFAGRMNVARECFNSAPAPEPRAHER